MHSRYRRSLLALGVSACVFGAFASANLALEHVSRFAEVHLGAHLWWQEEYLQLFTPSNYVNRGQGRLLIYGPSEAREAFLPKQFALRLPEWKAYQHAQSIGTLEDGLVVLNYIERAYGPTAIPDALVVGITTRFMANIRPVGSPLYKAIEKYSPYFHLDERSEPPMLTPKTTSESWLARFEFLRHQKRRYRGAIKAALREPIIRIRPELANNERLQRSLTPSKYRHLPPWPVENKQRWLDTPGSFWEAVHAWDPSVDRERIATQLGELRAFASRLGIELFIVNMPEISLNRVMYAPGRYEAYLDAVQSAIPDVPFLNLREFLADDEYYDSCHPTWQGSIRFSDRVAEFIAEHRKGGALDE